MKNIGLLCSLVAVLMATGCGEDLDMLSVPSRVFERSRITITADTDVTIVGRRTTITMRCMPLVDGKGAIGLSWSDSRHTGRWAVLEPLADTLDHNREGRFRSVELPMTFQAGMPVETSWTIMFLTSSEYYISTAARLDSIYIPDSSRYFWYESEIARRHSPEGRGYLNYAGISGSGLVFSPTP